MDEINWDDRLIAIKGSRGVGKTTFLLQYAKERFGHSRECLYINFNNFYFTKHSNMIIGQKSCDGATIHYPTCISCSVAHQ